MKNTSSQSGMTLIETIVAIFVLVMALSTGLGLAIYSIGQTASTRDRIIATNLAREGIDVIRMFRDSNWLMAEASATGSDDFYETSGGCQYPTSNSGSESYRRPCYPHAFWGPYKAIFRSTAVDDLPNNYRITWSPAAAWDLNGDSSNYMLCLQNDGSYQHHLGAVNCTFESAKFARRVTIVPGNVLTPYTPASSNPSGNQAPGPTGNRPQRFGRHSPELVVTSTIIWQGKRCAPFTSSTIDPVSFATPCKLVVQERITNWKDYK